MRRMATRSFFRNARCSGCDFERSVTCVEASSEIPRSSSLAPCSCPRSAASARACSLRRALASRIRTVATTGIPAARSRPARRYSADRWVMPGRARLRRGCSAGVAAEAAELMVGLSVARCLPLIPYRVRGRLVTAEYDLSAGGVMGGNPGGAERRVVDRDLVDHVLPVIVGLADLEIGGAVVGGKVDRGSCVQGAVDVPASIGSVVRDHEVAEASGQRSASRADYPVVPPEPELARRVGPDLEAVRRALALVEDARQRVHERELAGPEL